MRDTTKALEQNKTGTEDRGNSVLQDKKLKDAQNVFLNHQDQAGRRQ
jgi:hypothetical protein